jgi:hypothetical protein
VTKEAAVPRQHTPFETLEAAFDVLCEGPGQLAVDGRRLGWPFPPRAVPMGELRARLLHPSTPHDACDRALAVVARRAKADGDAWTVALAGLLMPGLRAVIGPVTRAWPREAVELEADVLAALVAALADLRGEERIAARLVWRAAGPVRRRAVRELPEAARRSPMPVAAAPRRPWGHPDFVLGQAVAAGAITPDESRLIEQTRLDGQPLGEWAESAGLTFGAARMRRMRAEHRLVEWIAKKSA